MPNPFNMPGTPRPPRRTQSYGSGVIIDSKGLILTNHHVVAGRKNAIITVTLSDQNEFEATIIGISKDSVAKHDKFKAKYELPFTLASDEDGAVCEAYGVWVEKSMYGRKYMGIERATFLLDGDGVIRNVWRKVKVKGHAEAVLNAAKEI